MGSAFFLRSDDEYLSVNWLESTGRQSRLEQLEIVRNHFTAKDMTLAKSACLAVLHLQSVFDHVESETLDSRRLNAHHEPDLPQDPSHAGIYDYTFDENDLIADLIAQVILEIHPAKQ